MHDDDDRLDRDALEAWQPDVPPTDFADRVLRARAERAAEAPPPPRSPNPPWLRRSAVVVAVVSAAVIALALARAPGIESRVGPLTGSVVASGRQTVSIGARAAAVAEPGASLSYRVAADGGASVEQTTGSVFYRVEPGAEFAVQTPAGTISVRGTCFSVEVHSMKPSRQSLAGAAIGAAVSATVLLTVYEGRVLFANDKGSTDVAAGQRATASPAVAPSIELDGEAVAAADIATPDAPAANASRAELLAHAEAQRDEIAELRARLAQAEQGGATVARRGGRGADEDPRAWLNPTKEQLLQYARDCRVRIDAPPLFGTEVPELDAEMAGKLGIAPDEVPIVNRLLSQFRVKVEEELKALYIEATGDVDGAQIMSLRAMESELRDKSPPEESARVRQRVAQERAGLVPAPGSTRGMSPYERYFRMLAAIGDEFEAALAAELGADRTREMREEAGGFGMRMDMSGCPDDAGASENIEE